MILPCTCNHPYQDSLYGRGHRVHNLKKDTSARCTVCGNVKSSGLKAKAAVEKK